MEQDPTAIDPDDQEPDEDSLPEKPPMPDVPEEGVDAPTDQEEHEVAVEPMDSEEADKDDTVDNEEQAEEPHTDLPKGARAEDYEEQE